MAADRQQTDECPTGRGERWEEGTSASPGSPRPSGQKSGAVPHTTATPLSTSQLPSRTELLGLPVPHTTLVLHLASAFSPLLQSGLSTKVTSSERPSLTTPAEGAPPVSISRNTQCPRHMRHYGIFLLLHLCLLLSQTETPGTPQLGLACVVTSYLLWSRCTVLGSEWTTLSRICPPRPLSHHHQHPSGRPGLGFHRCVSSGQLPPPCSWSCHGHETCYWTNSPAPNPSAAQSCHRRAQGVPAVSGSGVVG